MKSALTLATVLIVGMMTATLSNGQDRDSNRSSGDRFTGAWRLVWLEEQGPDGKIRKADCTGMLIFTPDRRMSVQVMYHDAESGATTTPAQYAQGGYEASFGKYEIDDEHTFTFHVEGALVRMLVGKDLKRIYEISGNQLIVKSLDSNEHWRVAWEHY